MDGPTVVPDDALPRGQDLAGEDAPAPAPAHDDPPPPAEPESAEDLAGAVPAAPNRMDPRLRLQLETEPDTPVRVSVWFSSLPAAAELVGLGLLPTAENPAVGQLDPAQIETLARRTDVVEVTLRPRPTLS
jgi:hypothetical protein